MATQWELPEWQCAAHEWIRAQLERHGGASVEEITQPHNRPWATAMRVTTAAGVSWFKATIPVLRHESGLTEALWRWAPTRVGEVLAADTERNWLLMADGGVTLRSTYGDGRAGERLQALARSYAALQRDVARYAAQMIELRTPDCRLARFPELYESLIAQPDALRIGAKDGLTAEQADRLARLVPTVAAIASELAAFGIPETVQHDDLHSNNVLVKADRLAPFDWGDCSVSHPFLSLVVLLRVAERDLNAGPESAEVQAVRTAYLEGWDLPLSRRDLDRACLLADALGRISRALTWARLAAGLDSAYCGEHASSVSGWLEEFLAAPALTA